ncbi:hypothetical protein MKZ38_001955 [Zalerion maritima]|uniref:PSP1 C-terminal domain-containing protein n=1 Tax=Zalerion maritima TaxID=339359 RepID=A0AAD5WSU2_9PEZI|nr:hypothetical protein MKZ38_001955 [Zalerion maritima]
MSSGPVKLPPSKPGQGGRPPAVPNNSALMFEKLNRRTPDSEALASSDDEGDAHRQELPRPVRRQSWLNDPSPAVSQPPGLPRKASFASSSMSPTTSHPTTPSADVGAWGQHSATGVLGRTHPGSASFPWGTGIWNSERKEPPSRLSEVLPSPTSTMASGNAAAALYSNDASLNSLNQTSPVPRENGPNPQIPFQIPLHPTPKTYRSQSYSVGQLEPEASNPMNTSAIHGGSRRPVAHPGLQHRPSRPSMLSEMSSDLGKVKEVEDDEEESNGSIPSNQAQSSDAAAKTIEYLARENALLRHQQQQQQYQNRLRPRASTSYGLGNGYSPVPEESDYAIEELDESVDNVDAAARRVTLTRRMSEFGAGSGQMRPPYALENRKLENIKKAAWQSSLGFSGLGDVSQSRRHSFADVPIPTRQGSISSMSDAVMASEPKTLTQEPQQMQDFGGNYGENPNYLVGNAPSVYFGGGPTMSNQQHAMSPSSFGGSPYPSSYSLQQQYSQRPASPHRAMYGMSQPRHNQLLHIVLFKCARADVFYIQEGTGLSVKPGDLVIVEADRGTDLGTVAKENVDWQQAKDLKEHYAEEQYKWLMMYSQNAAAAQEGSSGGLLAASNGLHGSAIGGMGPAGQHHMQEQNSSELKPKLIKRLAQSHEIHALRDKEGNEAKAKRVCMQKVKEHGLNMEILDAEFQMDWKKLTFYYFADSYINFNSLVTDLFKIYKTRIWMSAINPASFASPTLGLQAPSGIGPGAVGVGRGSGNSERRQNPPQEQQQPGYAGAPQHNRSFQGGAFTQSFGNDGSVVQSPSYQQSGYPGYPGSQYGGAFGNTSSAPSQYVPGMMQAMDQYQGGFSQGGDFGAVRGRYPGVQGPGQDASLAGQGEWVNQFQGLSLNSR